MGDKFMGAVLVAFVVAAVLGLFYIKYKEEHQVIPESSPEEPPCLEPSPPMQTPLESTFFVHQGLRCTRGAEQQLCKQKQYRTAIPRFESSPHLTP